MKFDDDPDWSAFDGKVVVIHRLWASRVNRLAEPPHVAVPCRSDVLALTRARVAASHGIFDLIENGRPSEGLAVVERAARLPAPRGWRLRAGAHRPWTRGEGR